MLVSMILVIQSMMISSTEPAIMVLNTADRVKDIRTPEDTPEKRLQSGKGNLSEWLQSVDGLEDWERNLSLGDTYIHTSARQTIIGLTH